MSRSLKKKIIGTLWFPIYYPLAIIWNYAFNFNFNIHKNPIEELKFIWRD